MARLTTLEILDQLADTSSTLEKQEIIIANKKNKDFLLTLKYSLDPFIKFNIKKIPDHKPGIKTVLRFGAVVDKLKNLSNRDVTGARAIKMLANTLSQLSPSDEEVVVRIIKKDLRCGVGAKLVNKALDKQFIPVFNVMRCASYNEKNLEKINYPAIIQEKSDGMRVNFLLTKTGVRVFARSGKELDLGDKFLLDLSKMLYRPVQHQDYLIDGELLMRTETGRPMSRKKGNGLLTKIQRGKATPEIIDNVFAVIWDIVPLKDWEQGLCEISYAERFKFLRDNFNKGFEKDGGYDRLQMINSKIVNDFDQAVAFFTEMLEDGKEGAIIKNLDGFWKPTKASHQVKLKNETTGELIIKAVLGGTGKYRGMLGKFLCESQDGLLEVSPGTGFTDAQRKEYFTEDLVGTIIEVKFNEIISSERADMMSLFLPVFVKLRPDKDTANTLPELFEAQKVNK